MSSCLYLSISLNVYNSDRLYDSQWCYIFDFVNKCSNCGISTSAELCSLVFATTTVNVVVVIDISHLTSFNSATICVGHVETSIHTTSVDMPYQVVSKRDSGWESQQMSTLTTLFAVMTTTLSPHLTRQVTNTCMYRFSYWAIIYLIPFYILVFVYIFIICFFSIVLFSMFSSLLSSSLSFSDFATSLVKYENVTLVHNLWPY